MPARGRAIGGPVAAAATRTPRSPADMAEKEALASDVLVQFWGAARARIPRAAATSEGRRSAGMPCLSSSLTRLPPRTAHFVSPGLALAAKQALPGKSSAARKLLREKGAKALLELHRAPVLARR